MLGPTGRREITDSRRCCGSGPRRGASLASAAVGGGVHEPDVGTRFAGSRSAVHVHGLEAAERVVALARWRVTATVSGKSRRNASVVSSVNRAQSRASGVYEAGDKPYWKATEAVSNVIPLSSLKPSHAHVVTELLQQPPRHSHAVQFYEEPEFLFDTVGHFLGAGLDVGDRLIVIASAAHRAGFLRRVGEGRAEQAMRSGQLTLVDARETLAKFMIDDMPDPDLFREVLERLMIKATADSPERTRVRAFGEMVDLLWREGNAKAAIRLEEFWNEASERHEFSLLCAYVMGNFYTEGDSAQFLEVCRNHSHVIPTETFAELDDPHARLREISLLQQRARALESELRNRKELEDALRDALRERSRTEEQLRASVRREHEARVQAERSDSFKEVFLGILGHDLRNPLNTILTTTRLMTIRGELPPESQKRIERVESSGIRMQRMIEQILDVTRDRLAAGIPVVRGGDHDLVPLVAKIVEEIRVAHPTRSLILESDGNCRACVDPDRLEQVISNLLGNAVAHGDPSRPIRVSVAVRGGVASVKVHNYGPPIDPDFMGMLFDPFKRAGKPQKRSEGLGLGLYISERIINAHGGRIEVESSEENGTSFEAIFPCKS
jgi:signal transduction histidine kinase